MELPFHLRYKLKAIFLFVNRYKRVSEKMQSFEQSVQFAQRLYLTKTRGHCGEERAAVIYIGKAGGGGQ